ncbi:MAG: hypothetical protein Q7R31_00135 [Candidatus Levybacteria bacterium]|nr:hypothetical protein [Candidatus Levybacteria bacterium]
MRAIAELLRRPKKAETPIVVDVHALAAIANAKPADLREAPLPVNINHWILGQEAAGIVLGRKVTNHSTLVYREGEIARAILAQDRVHDVMESLRNDIPKPHSTASVTDVVFPSDGRWGVALRWHTFGWIGATKEIVATATEDEKRTIFISDSKNKSWVSLKKIIGQHPEQYKAYLEALGKPEEQVSLLELSLFAMQFAR